MSVARRFGLWLVALLLFAATPAAAERLVISLSNHRLMVTARS